LSRIRSYRTRVDMRSAMDRLRAAVGRFETYQDRAHARGREGRAGYPDLHAQKSPAISPAAGVTAAQKTSGATPGRITRALPSNIATGRPAENGVWSW